MEKVRLCKNFRVSDKETAMTNNADQQKDQGLLHPGFSYIYIYKIPMEKFA